MTKSNMSCTQNLSKIIASMIAEIIFTLTLSGIKELRHEFNIFVRFKLASLCPG